jgi:hypothetical protein
MAIEDHILAPYYSARLDQIGAKIQAVADAWGIPHFIPVPWALQIPIPNFRYTAPGEHTPGYLKATKKLPGFPASCFGGFVILEENAVWITQIDIDDPQYPTLDLPDVIPNSHPILARADIKILDNAYTMVDSTRTECSNVHKIDKSYKEQVLPIWIRPTPANAEEASKTELATDEESANPAVEALARQYIAEAFILEQTMEDGTKIRDLSKFVSAQGKSLIKLDLVLNGYLLFNPNCRFRLFGPTGFSVPSVPGCDLVNAIKEATQLQY